MRCFIILLLVISGKLSAQKADSTVANNNELKALKFNLNASGTRFFQATFLNQVWLRYAENNPGTTRFSKAAPESFDIGLRRTRTQLFGQITDRTFLYFQFGQNNFNSNYNHSGNRKLAAFFHDALCEYRISKGNQLKIGAGMTIMNGLSRFSQPSITTIMTLDVPVFLQYSVDQIDQFDRRLAVYARGQIKKFDYRFYLSDPFPVTSNGASPAPISTSANFVNTSAIRNGTGPGVSNQLGTYLAYNFFEPEAHLTPYMTGTHLGTKKIFNIGAGAVYQKNATWYQRYQDNSSRYDTVFQDLLLVSIESYLDIPLSKEKKTALSAFAGYFITDYGKDYLRYNGLMNPGTASTATNLVQPAAVGNAIPMFGTGEVIYLQAGWLLNKDILPEGKGQLMPYIYSQNSWFDALEGNVMSTAGIGINWLMDEHRSKLSLEFHSRPTFYRDHQSAVKEGARKSGVTLQFQIAI